MAWIVLLVVVLGALIYLYRLPGATHVVRSIVINKPVPEVYAYVADFANWNAWSPWILHEPTCKTETVRGTEVGGTHSWDGDKIGAGQMQYTALESNQRVEMLLTFLRPFKSKADVAFAFKDVGTDGNPATEVTWTMQGAMPFVMRPFIPMMQLMIGHDFALGLGFLRGKLDPASEHPALSFNGAGTVAPQLYLTEPFEGTLADMRGAMYEAYPRLWSLVEPDPSRNVAAPAVAAYYKIKPLKGTVKMAMGMPVSRVKQGEQSATFGEGRYFVATYKGNYDFIGSAWNAVHGHAKMDKLKVDNSRPALEIYDVNPMQATHSNDWVTRLCVPLK